MMAKDQIIEAGAEELTQTVLPLIEKILAKHWRAALEEIHDRMKAQRLEIGRLREELAIARSDEFPGDYPG